MSVAPRPGSGGSLSSPALHALDGLVGRLVANQRAIAALEAEQRELLAACADVIPLRAAELRGDRKRYSTDLPAREVVCEVAVALRVGERGIQARLDDASLLVSSFPGALVALQEGRIDTRHVAVILDAGAMLERPADRMRFEKAVLPIAERESAARLRSHARALAAATDPEAVDRRVEDAQARRTVRMYDLDDDLSRLILDQPATLIHAIYDRVTQQAKAFRASAEAGDTESEAQAADPGRTADPAKGPTRMHGERDAAGPLVHSVSAEGDEEADDDRVVVVTRPGSSRTDFARGAADGGTGRDSTMGDRDSDGDVVAETDAMEDGRTLDQIRADILADVLLTGAPTGHGAGLDAIRAIVQVTVPLDALVAAPGDDDASGAIVSPYANHTDASRPPDHPLDLGTGLGRGSRGDPGGGGHADHSESRARRAGAAILSTFGAIPIATARTLAGHTPGWERVCLDATTGLPVAVDRYKPTARQRAYLVARDERCRFPGCVRPAHRCDLDHTHDAALGGATCVCNLAHFCRRHHTIKHHTAWTVRQLGGGVLEWTSPTGRLYEDRPPSTVRFVPAIAQPAGEPGREIGESGDAPPF